MFLVYLISGVAETNRAPFDVAEGESEIVAGYHVDYSGMAFAVFFMAEYANMILICRADRGPVPRGLALAVSGPGRAALDRLDIRPRRPLVRRQARVLHVPVPVAARDLSRYRYDQIMRLGWKVFIPLTIVWIVVVGVAILAGLPPWFDAA